MNRFRYLYIVLTVFISIVSINTIFAQLSHPKFDNRKIHYIDANHFFLETPWDIQFGWSAIDDDGKPFRNLLDIKNSWNIGFVPSRIGISKKIDKVWKGELDFAFNKYRTNKLVNSEIITQNGSFFTLDLGVQLDLNRFLGYTWIIDPYVESGLGYTIRTISKFKNTMTYNFGIGANFWINDFIGAFIQSSGKIGFKSPFIRNSSNYFQHSLGIVFKISGNSSRFHIASMKLKKTYRKTKGKIRAKF